jgi:hypothetical protein
MPQQLGRGVKFLITTGENPAHYINRRMSAEGVVKDLSLYDSITGDIVAEEVRRGGCSWQIVGHETANLNHMCDQDLGATLTQQPSLLPSNEDAKILVLNCGAGYAGVTALQQNHRDVSFADARDEILQNVWKNVFLNAPDCMASVRCFSASGLHWSALDEHTSNLIW